MFATAVFAAAVLTQAVFATAVFATVFSTAGSAIAITAHSIALRHSLNFL